MLLILLTFGFNGYANPLPLRCDLPIHPHPLLIANYLLAPMMQSESPAAIFLGYDRERIGR
jgi:hypothetical protein